MKKILLFSLMVLLASATLRAQEAPALPFIVIDRNPATLAGAGQAVSGLYNPAAVPFTGSDIVISYQNWAPAVAKATHLNALAGVKLGKKLGLQVQLGIQNGEPYDLTDGSGNVTGSFKPSDVLFDVGMGFCFNKYLSGGVQLGFASSKLAADTRVTSLMTSLYVLFAKDGLRASAGVANLGTSVKASDGTSFGIPSSLKVGGAYKLGFGGAHAIDFKAEFDLFFTGGIGLSAGAEYGLKNLLFVRGGYHLGGAKAPLPSYASVGLGVKLYGFHLDAAYLLASETLGNTLSIGLGYAF